MCFIFFFFNDTATTEIYTLSLHDALPILGGILRAAGTMAVATLVSRITGLLRTIVLAAALGVGLVNDAYNTANPLPNIVYALLLGGGLPCALVPPLVHPQERDLDGGTPYAHRL